MPWPRCAARGRVVVASYLLSDGLFQDRLRASGADVVTEPLGTHPGLVCLWRPSSAKLYSVTQNARNALWNTVSRVYG
jgi:sirohydrochlorin ferrochelatase